MSKITVENDELVIRVPLNVTPTLSSTGKTHTIDSSHGFVQQSTPYGTVSVSINVFTKDATNYGKDGQRRAAAPPLLVKPANGAARLAN